MAGYTSFRNMKSVRLHRNTIASSVRHRLRCDRRGWAGREHDQVMAEPEAAGIGDEGVAGDRDPWIGPGMKKPDPDAPIRKTVTLPTRLWDEISEYRFDQRIGTETEAIRRLLVEGLRNIKRGTSGGKSRKGSGGAGVAS